MLRILSPFPGRMWVLVCVRLGRPSDSTPRAGRDMSVFDSSRRRKRPRSLAPGIWRAGNRTKGDQTSGTLELQLSVKLVVSCPTAAVLKQIQVGTDAYYRAGTTGRGDSMLACRVVVRRAPIVYPHRP